MALAIDRGRLVDWASKAISIPSFTGSEEEMARFVAQTFEELGLQVQWQQVEEGRANVLGTLTGAGGGPALMFNGHMDTSYSGREPWLAHVPGFQPEPFVREERLYGLGISNMKGALACYVEAVRALQDAGVRLRGDLLVAAVCGEIEKAQYGDARGAEYRGYATGTRHLVTHGGLADMCILGEPTEEKVVLGHFGSLWLRISTQGNFIHTAFSEGKRDQNSILRMREVLDAVLEWVPLWEDDPENSYRGAKAIVNIGALQGGFGWRVSRTPHRTDLFLDVRVPPTKPMPVARREVLDLVRELGKRFPDYGVEGEVYVTAPGAEIAEDHPLVAAIDESHAEVFGSPLERDVTRWFSDASALTRYGVPTVNYGTSTGLLDTEYGENLEIEGSSDGERLRAGGTTRLWGGMRLVTYDDGLVGELRDDRVVELDVPSMREYFERGEAPRATGREVALEDVRLRAPIVPKKFFHTAGNFREHEDESKNVAWSHEIAPWIVFFQNVDAIIGPDDPVVYPEHLTEELDYELELAVVIRKAGKWFSADEAADYIGGYVIFNDITARDIQRREMRSGVFSFCKAIDTFCPLGPWIVTPDEIPDPHDLAMELRVNGEPRQVSHSRNMSVSIPEILSHYSALGYSAGDVVSTGTVSGVAGFSDDPASLYLKPGDVMEAEIERIGVLRNPVVSWQEAHGEPAPERVHW
jgi:2-keto-4-pentenoate hydratase/2-oxohepta-3-ene-1,7-dioic acid hydratase in catechol pathway/acetylornithine deacetylase/succinyl-diaminopimelate desuccinylase-like protein